MLLYDFYSNDICQVYHICPLMMSGESQSPPQSELLQQVCGRKPVLVLGSV